jgi:hypothetical protein
VFSKQSVFSTSISFLKGDRMVLLEKTRYGVLAAALCLLFGMSAFGGIADSDIAGIKDGAELMTLFTGEANPYRRLAYFVELPSVIQRFGVTDKEAWVDLMIGKALDDRSADVVIAARGSIGSMNKDQFVNKLIALYSAVGNNALSLSESPIRCMIIRSLKHFSTPVVSTFLASVLRDPPRQNPTGAVVREALNAMNESQNPVFIEALASFSKSVQTKQAALQRELDALPAPAEKSNDGKRFRYNHDIQGYAEMIYLSDGIASSISGNKGGRK